MDIRSTPGTAGTAVAGLGLILLALTGCAVVNDVAYGRAESSAANPAELAQTRGAALAWMPSDAADIRRVASTRADAESLLFTSDAALSGCEPVERRSAPTMIIDGAPDVYPLSEVQLCGEWAVATVDGVSYAWTPAIEAEPAR
ncbi:hypothetical protein ACIQLJ_01385 [Microbacterium sp. NPDC091313]